MKQGAIFVDDNDLSTAPRLLFYIESSVQDGVLTKSGTKRIISQNLHFVELDENGNARNAGYAPYLDYRAPSEEERQLIAGFLPSQRWLTGDVESKAMNYAIGNIIPQHFLAVKERRVKAADKTMKAVKERLTAAFSIGITVPPSSKRKKMPARATLASILKMLHAARKN